MFKHEVEVINECVECAGCKTIFPCECGRNRGIPSIDPIHANTGYRFAMSEEQARLYNSANEKNGLSLIQAGEHTYELWQVVPRT
jgi:hypothetical protein